MGCASAKHVSAVQNEEDTQKGKNYQNGDVFGDEYRIKPVEEVKYMKNGGEDDQKIAARNQENLEKDRKQFQRRQRISNTSMRNREMELKRHAERHFVKIKFHRKTPKLRGEKSASSHVRLKPNKELPGLVHQPRANMHISESQQEFFRMLDEKIEKGRDYCSEEEDVT